MDPNTVRAPLDVRIIVSWQTYSVGEVIRECPWELAQWLMQSGYAEKAEAETPSRPAKFAKQAADKLAQGARGLFK